MTTKKPIKYPTQTYTSSMDSLVRMNGKTIQVIEITHAYNNRLFSFTIELTDGTSFDIEAGSVSFDQYSSTPCIYVDENQKTK